MAVSSLLAALVLAPPAGASKLVTKPRTQAITLGQGAVIRVQTRKRCRVTSPSGARIRRAGRVWVISVRPVRAGTLRVTARCSGTRLTARVTARRPAVDPAPGAPGSLPAASSSRLGTNLGAVTYYDGVVPFSDLVLQAGDWLDSFTARSDGWPASLAPGQQARVPIAEARYPAGRYQVSWRGEGRFTVGPAAFSGADGRGQVELDGEALTLLTITQTSPSNPLRAIKVVAPGESGLFRSRYLEQLGPYGILRFMDWQRTNGSFADPAPRLTCDNRTTTSTYSQGTRKGVSAEIMVELANRTGAAPWFTIPHKADEAFAGCVAAVVAERLRSDLTPRFEFSNETWNPGFEQFHDLQAEGASLGDGDPYLGLQRIHARRHRAVMAAVDRALGGRRFIRVLSGQAANSWVLEQRLGFEDTARQVDEIAVAPYVGEHDAFDPQEAERVAGLSRDQLFAELRDKLQSEVRPWILSHRELASRNGKRLVAYEAGQHLAGEAGNDRLTALFTSANRDPLMGDLYDRYFALWDELTGKSPLVHFTDAGPYTRFGSWGALETPDQDPRTSPKYQALLRQAAR